MDYNNIYCGECKTNFVYESSREVFVCKCREVSKAAMEWKYVYHIHDVIENYTPKK